MCHNVGMNDNELLQAGPMARRMRVPVRWLKAEAEKGNIPCLNAGGVFLFHPEVVERILLERAGKGEKQ